MKKNILKFLFLMFITISSGELLLAQESRTITTNSHSETTFPQSAPGARYDYKIITVSNDTFGYEILQNNNLFIRQTTIPGIPGKSAFRTKQDAEKVANIIIQKLKNGEMPPIINPEELKHLNIK